MIIDLSSINNSDYKLEYQEKSKMIMDNLKGYDNGYSIIVSISIFNILETDSRFTPIVFESVSSDGIFKIGNICGFECYVDKYMKSNEILITYNKVKMRDNKIDYLLNNQNLIKEKRVKIIS
jgi:hypothetical protein